MKSLYSIFKVMDNRAKVQREEAVPEGEFAQAGYSFTLQFTIPTNTENNSSLMRCQDPLHVTHGKQVVLVEVVCRLGGIE